MNQTSPYQPPSYGGPDPLAIVSDTTPKVKDLQQAYQDAWNQDDASQSRLALAEDIRYTRWVGQSTDGLKHQEAMPEGRYAMPYDRAPDTRINLADSIIMQQVDVEYAAFWNARVNTSPTSITTLSVAQAAEWRRIISWMIHGPLKHQLIDQVEFASQVLHTVGWVCLHPCWRKREQLRLQHITFDDVLSLAAKAQNTVLAAAPQIIMDPEQEEAATNLIMLVFPQLKRRTAERVARELRTKQRTSFPIPVVIANAPELSVLVPWQDFILPIEATAAPHEARAVFRRLFETEAQVRERARAEEWNEAFLEKLIETKGTAMEEGTSQEHDADLNNKLIEFVYAYNRGVDEDDVPGIYCTVISPHLIDPKPGAADRESYGQHWLINSPGGEYPFIFLTTEVTGRRPGDARGTPTVVQTQQNEMKQQRDATYVYSQLSVTPPLQKKGTQASRLPPELGPLGVINNAAGGEWSWFPPPPGHPEIAFQLVETVRREVEDYYGIPRPDLPAMRWQPRQQRPVTRFLAKWGQAFWHLSVLCYQNLEPDEIASILGRPPLLTVDSMEKHLLMLWFDVRALDPDWVSGLLEQVAQFILPTDSGGVVDRAKLTRFALAYLDPTLAEEVTADDQGAKQQLFKAVRDDVNSMMLGNEAIYTENDPTAKAKLAFTDQIVKSNPDFILQLDPRSPQFAPRKRELIDKYVKNLQQSVMQQDNKMIGRLGVKPGPEPIGASNGNGNGNGGGY